MIATASAAAGGGETLGKIEQALADCRFLDPVIGSNQFERLALGQRIRRKLFLNPFREAGRRLAALAGNLRRHVLEEKRYRHVQYIDERVSLRAVRPELRQLAVLGLGRDEPTLFLTNDFEAKPAVLVDRYAHRMLIENSIAENVDFFHLDALSSAIALQVGIAAYRRHPRPAV